MALFTSTRLLVAGFATIFIVSEGFAEPIPAALRGNSIVLSWSDYVVWKDEDDNARTASHDFVAKVYASTQDRIFSSLDVRKVHRRHTTGSTTNEVSGSGDHKLQWKFEGGALIADQHFHKRGARRLVISFTDDFKSCSIDVIVAKEAGAVQIKENGRELGQVTITSQSCAVQPGNVFAN